VGQTPDRRTILQGGRPKAYRPLPRAAIQHALDEGLAAYRHGRFFEAHELLEPAWMGTDDLPERELYQGLIKLAAAFVHHGRGNAAGVEKNLAGARRRLLAAKAGAASTPGVDLDDVLVAVDMAIAALERGDDLATIEPIPLGGRRGRPGGP
jgi:predicted metal-dependent hydrolase